MLELQLSGFPWSGSQATKGGGLRPALAAGTFYYPLCPRGLVCKAEPTHQVVIRCDTGLRKFVFLYNPFLTSTAAANGDINGGLALGSGLNIKVKRKHQQ